MSTFGFLFDCMYWLESSPINVIHSAFQFSLHRRYCIKRFISSLWIKFVIRVIIYYLFILDFIWINVTITYMYRPLFKTITNLKKINLIKILFFHKRKPFRLKIRLNQIRSILFKNHVLLNLLTYF